MVPDLPYHGLRKFGTAFLHKFEAAIVTDAPLLDRLSFVDTPGVLSGEKQKREYDFLRVARWFAERSDLVLLMFDGSKLDISDEFKAVIQMLRPSPEKVRVVLNKADQIPTDELIRVIGALMWSLGKIVNTPEVLRIYIGSFWDKELEDVGHRGLMERDMAALYRDLEDLPQQVSVRRIEDMVIRVRLLRVHMCLLARLRSEMPWFFGRASRKQHLLDNLEKIVMTVCEDYDCSFGDIPCIDQLRAQLRAWEFSRFPRLSQTDLATLNRVLADDIPPIINKVHGVDTSAAALAIDQARKRERKRKCRCCPQCSCSSIVCVCLALVILFLLLLAGWLVLLSGRERGLMDLAPELRDGGWDAAVFRTILFDRNILLDPKSWLRTVLLTSLGAETHATNN